MFPCCFFCCAASVLILPAAAKWGGCCTNTAKRAMFPPSRAQKFSLFCPPVIFTAMWLLWIRTVPYNQIAIYLVVGVLAVATYLRHFADKSD